MNRSTFNLLAISIMLFLVAAAAAAVVMYSLETKGALLLGQMQSVRDQERLERAYDELEDEWLATAADRARAESLVLDSENDTIDFLAKIDDLAAAAGVVLTTDLQANKTDESGFDELVGSFSLQGPDNAIVRVLRQIESLPYDIQVSSLRFSRGDESGTAQLVLKVGTKE